MTAITTRLIVVAEGQPDPLDADNPQLLFVHDRAGINIDPVAIKNGPAPLDSVPDLWDMLVGVRFDKEGLVIVYEAEMQAEGGAIVVKQDQFGEGEYPYIWSGWPTPGDPLIAPLEDPAPLKLTEAQQEALDRASSKRKGDVVKTILRGKNEHVDAEPAKKSVKK